MEISFVIKVCVVIPCYRVGDSLLNVISLIEADVAKIYVVNDCCPDDSTLSVEQLKDDRICLLRTPVNLGVGGAVMLGYRHAIEDCMDIVVKIDGDGQMDPRLISAFIAPIIRGEADYTKGNRFYELEQIHRMPVLRVIGNAGLSFITKLSSGYWDIFDPSNGYTAISVPVLEKLPFYKISNRFFFESDMLFRLNILRAVVEDIPMDARYGNEISNLKIFNVFFEFIYRHIVNLLRRIFYNYYLRDMSLASFELPLGLLMLFFGLYYGFDSWQLASKAGLPATAGNVMISAVSLIGGLQLVLAFLAYDISSVPKLVLHTRLLDRR
jgi:dolichol-phosphate mannosyltransferase